MDYAKQSNEEQPFKGLSLEEKKRLWVYMCHISHPCFTPEEIEKRWGRVLQGDQLPTVFSALEIAKEIKDEILASATRAQPKGDGVAKKSRTAWLTIIIPCVVFLLIGLLCYLSNTEKMRKEVVVGRQLMKIEEGIGVDAVPQYNHLREIEKNKDESLDDVSSLVSLGEKFSFSNPQKSAEYYYRALRKNATLDKEKMMTCAKVFEQAKQLEKAITFYEGCARAGDLQAILWLGNYWYDQMCFSDNRAALGREYRLSHRWDRMPEHIGEAYRNAKYWLELAASKGGNLEVFLKLSLLYGGAFYNGSCIITSLQNALKFGSNDAAFELGVIYEEGLYNVVANQAEAKRMYLIAANKGHPYAQLSYAYLLESPQEAWAWVAKAANQGNVEAQYQFGRLHDFYGWGAWGIGRWKQLQCSRDSHWRSKQTIVPTYGCEKYQRSAIVWYRLAAKNGYKPAERELAAHNATLE